MAAAREREVAMHVPASAGKRPEAALQLWGALSLGKRRRGSTAPALRRAASLGR